METRCFPRLFSSVDRLLMLLHVHTRMYGGHCHTDHGIKLRVMSTTDGEKPIGFKFTKLIKLLLLFTTSKKRGV